MNNLICIIIKCVQRINLPNLRGFSKYFCIALGCHLKLHENTSSWLGLNWLHRLQWYLLFSYTLYVQWKWLTKLSCCQENWLTKNVFIKTMLEFFSWNLFNIRVYFVPFILTTHSITSCRTVQTVFVQTKVFNCIMYWIFHWLNIARTDIFQNFSLIGRSVVLPFILMTNCQRYNNLG